MRMFRLGVYLAGIACLFLTSLRADDTASPKAAIEKAIDAVGGLEKLNKYKAFTAKGTGKLSINGAEISFTFDAANQLPDKARVAIEGDFNGTKFTRIQIRNGDKGWVNTSGSVEEMTADQIAIAKEETYAGNVISLAVLNGPGYTLTAIPDAKVEGKPAVGVKVASKDHKDISLFFDKDSGMLIMSRRMAKDEASGEEKDTIVHYSDYKELDGVKRSMKNKILRDGNPFLELTNTEVKMAEKLDNSLFDKPGQ